MLYNIRVDEELKKYLPLRGMMNGNINLSYNRIFNCPDPINKGVLDDTLKKY